MHFLKTFLSVTSALVLLTGCTITSEHPKPVTETPAWRNAENIAFSDIDPEWWKGFASAELNTLMRRALDNNNDLQASLQRIEQARADVISAGASLLPSATVTAGYMSGAKQAMNITDKRKNGIPSFTGNAGISYEPDLFGANRANKRAAEDRLLASAYLHDALALVVMSDTAQLYFKTLGLKERIRIAEKNVRAVRDVLKVTETRFLTGARTELDITRQEAELSAAKAGVTALEQELAVTQNALAVLAGEPPQRFAVEEKNLDALTLAPPAALQPAALLERRPDIKSVEAMLKAANADIEAARAAFYPSVDIGAGLLLAADPAASALTLAGSVIAPVFQGGRLEGNLQRVTARQKELAFIYRQTILTAFQEAENALTTSAKTQKREDLLKNYALKARKAYEIATNQYSLSVIEFQDVLDAQRALLDAEDAYEQARYDTLAARVELFKAMGGGWNPQSE